MDDEMKAQFIARALAGFIGAGTFAKMIPPNPNDSEKDKNGYGMLLIIAFAASAFFYQIIFAGLAGYVIYLLSPHAIAFVVKTINEHQQSANLTRPENRTELIIPADNDSPENYLRRKYHDNDRPRIGRN